MSNTGPGDKTLKLGVGIDTQAFAHARGAIRQLTTELKQLVDVMNQARGGGGLGSAGGSGGLFGGFSSNRGGNNPGQQAVRGGLGMGGIAAGIMGDAKALTQVADAGTKAMRNMTQGAKGSITDQIQNLERLRRTVTDLSKAYEQLQVRATLPNGAPSPSAAFGMNQTGAALAAARSQLSAADANQLFAQSAAVYGQGGPKIVNRGGIDYYDDGSGPGPGRARRAWNFMNQALPGSGAAGSAWSWMRSTAAAVAAPVGIIAGGYEAANRALVARDSGLAGYALQGGQYGALQSRAGISQAYGGIGLGTRRDVNTALAVGGLTPTDLRSALGPEAYQAMVQRAYAGTGNTGSIGQAGKDIYDAAGNALSNLTGSSGATANPQLMRQLQMDLASQKIPAEQAQRLNEIVQAKLQSQSVIESTYRNEFAAQHLGRMGLMRSFGAGGGGVVGKEGDLFYGNRAQLAGFGSAFTASEVAGARAQLRGAAGARYQGGAMGILGYQAGGLGNAAELYGAAAGYGSPGGFLSALSAGSSMSGAQGLVDVTAAGQVGGLYAGGMTGGDMFTSGRAGLQGLMSTTAALGGDLRAARATAGGFSQLGAYGAGSTDRLQQAINVLSSVRAAPGSLYAQEALRNMSPAQRLDLMRQINSGNETIPEELRVQGVTAGGLKAYGKNRESLLFSRYVTGQGSPEMEAAVKGVRSKGLTGYLHGFSGAGLSSQITALGAAYSHAGGGSLEQSRAMIAQLAAEDPTLFKALKGGGIGDPARLTAEAEFKRNQDQNVLHEETYLAKAKTRDELRKSGSYETKQLATQFDVMSQQLGPASAAMAAELRNLTDAIHAAAARIRSEGGSGARARAGAP